MRIVTIAMAVFCSTALLAQAAPAAQPFDNSQFPPPKDYPGPTFKLSHDYPQTAPVPAMPWRAAINNGLITTANAQAYAEALKAAIGDDMRVLLQDYQHWDAGKRGWYNEPWLGKTSVAGSEWRMREPLRGMYVGSNDMERDLFKATGLKKDFTTYVLVYYDKTAAVTLNRIWGATAMDPNVTPDATQFAEGSIIVKAAFITAGPKVWPVMTGTQVWPAYIEMDATKSADPAAAPALTPTYLMQFDIIVKDSASAPKTGWVFTTLVYDRRIAPRAKDIWNKMVVLGAQWGNDPQADNPAVRYPVLQENWNNPRAPAYGSATLGWGQRLSGPNDGAMNNVGISDTVDSMPVKYVRNAKDSSCMSCHSSAQWDTRAKNSPSFLLPAFGPSFAAPPSCKTADCAGYLGSPPPGSELWLKWFKNRKGNEPMDPGPDVVAGDFDMVLTFKSLPAWATETKQAGPHPALRLDKRGKPLMRAVAGAVPK